MSCNLEQALVKVEELLKFPAIQKNIPFEIKRIKFEIEAMRAAKDKMLKGSKETNSEVKPLKETTYEASSKQDKTTKVTDTSSENLDTSTNNKLDNEDENVKDSPIKDKKIEKSEVDKSDTVTAPNNISGHKISETELALDEYLASDLTSEASNKSEESIISDKAPDTEHKSTITELMRCLNSYKG